MSDMIKGVASKKVVINSFFNCYSVAQYTLYDTVYLKNKYYF
jgi:hypothetical protein